MKIEKFLQISPIFSLQESAQQLSRYLNPHLKKEEVGLLQALILISLLFDQDQAIYPSTLTKVFRTSKSSLGQALTALEEKKYIKRVLDERDARKYRLILRKEGILSARRLVGVFDHLQSKLEKALGETLLQQMLRGIRDIQKILSPAVPTAANPSPVVTTPSLSTSKKREKKK